MSQPIWVLALMAGLGLLVVVVGVLVLMNELKTRYPSTGWQVAGFAMIGAGLVWIIWVFLGAGLWVKLFPASRPYFGV